MRPMCDLELYYWPGREVEVVVGHCVICSNDVNSNDFCSKAAFASFVQMPLVVGDICLNNLCSKYLARLGFILNKCHFELTQRSNRCSVTQKSSQIWQKWPNACTYWATQVAQFRAKVKHPCRWKSLCFGVKSCLKSKKSPNLVTLNIFDFEIWLIERL